MSWMYIGAGCTAREFKMVTLRTGNVQYTAPTIGVRAGGARGPATPPNFGQLRFFGQRQKIWAKPVFKDVSILSNYFKYLNINLKSA